MTFIRTVLFSACALQGSALAHASTVPLSNAAQQQQTPAPDASGLEPGFSLYKTPSAETAPAVPDVDWSAFENDRRLVDGAKAFRKKKYKRAEKLFRKAAADENPVAYLNLATVLNQIGYENRDEGDSLRWLKKAAQTGYPEAQYRYAGEIYDWDGSEKNIEGVIYYIKAAEADNGLAQSAVGTIYENGDDVDRNYKKSAYWFKRATEHDNYYAERRLDHFYTNGLVTASEISPKNIGIVSSREVDNFLNSLITNDKPAQDPKAEANYFAAMDIVMRQSSGDRQLDFQRAAELLAKSGELDYLPAQALLGTWFIEGKDIVRSYPQAAYWLKKAAENGDQDARMKLQFLLLTGAVAIGDLPSNSVSAGHKRTPEESFFAGLEAGYNKNFPQSEALLTEAAKEGHRGAQAALGRMYYEGEGIPQSLKLAYRWYRAAGYQGDAQSQYMMGYMWHHGQARAGAPSAGDFVSDTILEARRWYEAAAANGHEDAGRQLAAIADYAPPPPPPAPKPGWFEKFAVDTYQRAQNGDHSRPLSTRTSGGNPVYQEERCYQVSDTLQQCFRD